MTYELRRTGKTTNAVLAYVRVALDSAGSWVIPRDHHDRAYSHREVVEGVRRVLTALNVEHKATAERIRVVPIEPIIVKA